MAVVVAAVVVGGGGGAGGVRVAAGVVETPHSARPSGLVSDRQGIWQSDGGGFC